MSDEMKKCPFCGEEVNAVAIKCRFCGALLDNGTEGFQSKNTPPIMQQPEAPQHGIPGYQTMGQDYVNQILHTPTIFDYIKVEFKKNLAASFAKLGCILGVIGQFVPQVYTPWEFKGMGVQIVFFSAIFMLLKFAILISAIVSGIIAFSKMKEEDKMKGWTCDGIFTWATVSFLFGTVLLLFNILQILLISF